MDGLIAVGLGIDGPQDGSRFTGSCGTSALRHGSSGSLEGRSHHNVRKRLRNDFPEATFGTQCERPSVQLCNILKYKVAVLYYRVLFCTT